MRSKLQRLISLFLVLVLIIQMSGILSVTSFATETTDMILSDAVERSDSEVVTIVGEEISLRAESEKHFRLSDGSYIAVSYSAPVHFMNDNGIWQDIDNSPVMVADEKGISTYQISNGNVSTVFSSDLSNGVIFAASAGDVSVSMRILDTAQAAEYIIAEQIIASASSELSMPNSGEEYQVYSRETDAEIVGRTDDSTAKEARNWEMSDVIPDNLSSSIIYHNVFPGVDLQYNANGYQIKEEIIVKSPQNTYRYDFMVCLDGLSAVLNSDGSVSFVDDESREIYQIPAPYMVDAAGELSENVTYTLNCVEGGAILTVTADENWINDSNRQFPVRIDPTLNLKVYTSNNGQEQCMYITFVEENEPTQTGNGTDQIYIGYGQVMRELQGYIHVNTLPELPAGTVVTQTVLNMYMTSYSSVGCNELPIGLYEVDSAVSTGGQSYFNWIRNMSWGNKPGFLSSNMLDYVVLSEDTLYWNQGYTPVTWDLTELAKKWYREGTENRTIALALTSDDYSSSKCAVLTLAAYTSQGYSMNVSPSLIVSYRNNTGIEPYYSYTTLGVGSAGTAYIADATGQLKAGKTLVQYASSVNPVSVNLVYNSDYFASDNSAAYHPMTALGVNMIVGSGWRLDCVQKIETETISGTEYLKYFDGDGTIHYFLKDSSKSTTYYYDEDGLGLKIKSTGTNAYEMSDDFGNKWIFTDCFLTEISDETGNKVLIQYSDGKLISVIQQNNGYGQITAASFSYNGETVESVTDAAGNVYLLGYSGEKLISVTKRITKNGETNECLVAQYDYSGYRLNLLNDTESSYSVVFTYSDGSISRFQEKVNTTTGATVEVTYPNYTQTTYTNYGADRCLGISDNQCDDISTHYLFDHAGRTVNAYTTDSSGTVLGASNAIYSGAGSTDKKNNRTMQTSSIGMAGQQLLRNTGFELGSGWTLTNTSIVQTGQRTGMYALKGTMLTSGTVSADRTTEALVQGTTYTFSAYVNTNGVTNFGSEGICLQVSQGSNTWTSPKLNYKSGINGGWVRISVTFTAASSAAHTVSVRCDGSSEANGTFYVDDLQLEVGEAPSNVNLLENGNMAMSSYNWVLSDAASVVGDDYLQINGSPADTAANASQTVNINLPSSETYVLSGWVKAYAVPDNTNTASDPAQDTLKQCGLRAVIKYSDNSLEYHYFPFNADLSDWQFVSGTIVPQKESQTVSEITVYCAYEGNANIAQFDNISLVREVAQTMAYDDDGNLQSVTSTGLQADQNTYENGNLIKTVTGGYGTYQYDYDDTYAHRLTAVKLVDNDNNAILTQTMGYDGVGNVTSTTLTGSDGKYLTTSATYDGNLNRLITVTDASGKTVQYQYADTDNQMMALPSSEQLPNGTVFAYDYDSFYRIKEAAVEGTSELVYNYYEGYLQELVRTSIGNGSTQTYTFRNDAFGNTEKIEVGSRTLASYTYAPGNGLLQKLSYGNGAAVNYTYDDLGRMKTVGFADGRTLTYTYSGDGHLYSTTETGGSQTVRWLYTYDSLDRLISGQRIVDDQPDIQVYYGYNEYNQLATQSWQVGSQVYTATLEYNSELDGSLNTFNPGIGNVLTMGYDSLRRLSSVTGGVYSKTYTYRGFEDSNQTTTQVSQLTYALPTVRIFAYAYDNMGNIAAYTDANGRVDYTYDGQGQLIKAVVGDTVYSYSYDVAGNITNFNGIELKYEDENGWVDLLTKVGNGTITYDAIGNPLSYYNGTRWTFGWANGRQLVSASTGTDLEDVTVSYTYEADGMRTGKTVTTVRYQAGHTHSYTSTVVAPTCTENGYTLHECTCGDSYQDNVTTATGHSYTQTDNDTTIQYTCTVCGHSYTENVTDHVHSYTATVLVEATCTETGSTLYECACGYSYEESTAALGHSYTQPVTFWSKCQRCGASAFGFMSSDESDAVNASSEAGVMAASEDRVVESTVVQDYDYIYNGGQLVRMTVTTTVDNGTPTSETLDFFYDASGHPYALKYGDAVYYYITNLQGDVMYIVGSNGQEVVSYTYDPYGNVLEIGGTANDTIGPINPLRYRGYVYDTESGLYYLQSRYYDPKIGRFINADAYASTGQGILGNNMFAYCGNNPVNRVDTTGTISIQAIKAIATGLMDAVICLSTGGTIWEAAGVFALGVALDYISGISKCLNLSIYIGQAVIQVFEIRAKGGTWAQSIGAGVASLLGGLAFGSTNDEAIDLLVDLTFGFAKSLVSEGVVSCIEQNIYVPTPPGAPYPLGNDSETAGIWGGGATLPNQTMMT